VEHLDQITQQLGVLGVIEPQARQPVAHFVAERVEVRALQVAVGVGEQPGDERHERLAVVLGAHRCDLVRPDTRGGQAQHVGPLEGAADPALGHHLERTVARGWAGHG
jgi:hypothetical protein